MRSTAQLAESTNAVHAASQEHAVRWLLGAGIAFAVAQLGVLLYFGATVASKWPPVDAPAAERAAHLAANWAEIRFANFLLPLPTPFFLLFLGGMYGVLRRAEGGESVLAVTALVAGAAAAMVWPVGMVLGALAMDIGRQGGDLVTMQVLEGIAPMTLGLGGLPRAVLTGAAGAVVLRTGCAPRWLGWAGLLLVPLFLAAPAVLLTPAGFPLAAVGKLLFLVWIAAFSIGALRGPARA